MKVYASPMPLLATHVALALLSKAKVSSCSSASNGAHSDWSAVLLLSPVAISMLTERVCESTTVTTAEGVLAPARSKWFRVRVRDRVRVRVRVMVRVSVRVWVRG